MFSIGKLAHSEQIVSMAGKFIQCDLYAMPGICAKAVRFEKFFVIFLMKQSCFISHKKMILSYGTTQYIVSMVTGNARARLRRTQKTLTGKGNLSIA